MKEGTKKIVMSVVTAVFVVGLVLVLKLSGCASFRSGIRIGYAGSELPSSWTGSYVSIKGNFSKSLTPKGDALHIEITTSSGELNVEITNADKEVIYQNTFTGDETLELPVTGKVKIKLSTGGHSGSFSFK